MTFTWEWHKIYTICPLCILQFGSRLLAEMGGRAMKALGVIGGMGPMATAYFLQLIIAMTDVDKDQKHIPIYMQSIPGTPDRTAYILDHTKENPLPALIAAGQNLKEQGAEYIAIPCVTAHYFHEILEKEIGLPVIALPKEAAVEFQRQNITRVGILATSGTVKSRLVQNVLKEHGIEAVIPDESEQQMLMSIIYDQIKAGRPINIEQFLKLGKHLKAKGAERILLGCTELSLIKRDFKAQLTSVYVDVLEVLARAVISYNRLPLRNLDS